MTGLTRTVRTGNRMRLRADSMLSTALLVELAHPGDSVWLVSGWITDIEVIDNTQGAFDTLLGDNPPAVCRLSQILSLIADAGARIHVVTRDNAHNRIFAAHLERALTDPERQLDLHFDDKIHEKTLCGRNWMLTGSMNFTISGLGDNEESVTYKIDDPEIAQAHLDFTERWKEPA
ncbi:phospholipase D-like domain-containing protein DpdK [Nocardia sp. AB354]|uniref:phospholipase D-like domain-containing protein DpdK n=1 Tax=Nocardia sp. AB354 TaxID=3413283 RepID=UPI003C229F9C